MSARLRALLRGAALAGLVASPVAFAAPAATIATPPDAARASVEVYFSPDGDVDKALAAAIGAATRRVWVAGYFFTSSAMAKALHEAHARRGVDVRIVLDRSQATLKYSSATYFHNQGVPLRINARYPVMHHKFILIDADSVGFGSMNFTRAGAHANAENFNLFRRWPQLAQTYAAEFVRLEQESEPYAPGMVFAEPGGAEKTD